MALVAYNAGSAFISIAPSFRGFNTKVAAHMRTLRPATVPVEFKASSKPITPPPVKQPVIRPEVDSRSALRSISAIESRLDRLARGRFLINVGIAASPLAVPAVAAGAGALGALGAVGGAGLAGVAGFATIATASLERVLESQEALTKATEDRTAAVGTLRSAEASLAAAVQGAQRAQLDAARAVADAERSLADARRNASRQVQDAERALADARRSASRSVADAERALASAREEAARRSAQAQQEVVRAQEQLVASQEAVRRSLDDLHAAREQAKRDLADLAERTRDNALTIEGAEIGLIEAQQRLAELEGDSETSALDLRKARLDLAVAEDRLSDARRRARQDAAELAAAEKAGINGAQVVQDARAQLEQARQDRRDAGAAVAEARRAAQRVEIENARDIADAERNLRQTRLDAARSVADAERNLAQTRADASRSVADAERNLARTRADSAQSVADANRRVAEAQRAVAEAGAAVAAADQARAAALAGLNPAQQAAVRAVDRLKEAWNGFLDATSRPVLGALVVGMDALRGALPALANFIRPVARGFGDMFRMFGDAASSKGFQRFATTLGRFAREILGDAARGILNLARGFGNLFLAFMPLGSDMSDGIVKLTERFAKWSRTVGESAGFKSFIAYVRETGPLLLSTLGALVKAIIEIGIALAPMAAAMLRGLQVFAQWVAKTAEAHPWLVRLIAGFAVLVAGVSAVARPLAAIVGVFRLLATGIGMAVSVVKIVVFNLRILWMVLRANPLGLVITVIGLLVAGFVLAYKKSETFRKIVDTALAAVKAAAVAVVVWFTKEFVPFFTKTIPNAFKTLISWVRRNWPVILAIITGPIGLAVLAVVKNWDKITAAFRAAKNWVVGAFKNAWSAVTEVVVGAVRSAKDRVITLWGNIRGAFSAVKDWVTTGFKNAWRGVKTIITDPVQAAKNVFDNLLGRGGSMRRVFSNGIDAIKNAWERLRTAAKRPVNFVIESVYNNGIRAGFNKVAEFLGLDTKLPRMNPIGGGGRRLPTSAGRRSPGVQAFGGPSLTGWLGKGFDWVKDKALGGVLGKLQSLADSPFGRMVGGIGRKALDAATDWLKGKFTASQAAAAPGGKLGSSIGRAGVVLPRGSYSIGMPYLGYPGHYGADYPAATGTPVYSPWPGRVTATYDIPGSNPYNNTPYASYGRVVKISHPNGLSTLYAHLSSRIGSTGPVAAGQMIGRVGTNGNSTGPHLHFEVGRGAAKFNPASLGIFDAGGLARTAGLMAKGPAPERVLSPQQTAAFEKAMDRGVFDRHRQEEMLVRLTREDMDYLATRTGSDAGHKVATVIRKGRL